MRLLLALYLLPSVVISASISFLIPPHSLVLPNPATLPASTHATLFRLDSTLTAPLTRRNTFDFANVTPGSYLFTVQCRDYNFPPLRVDVSSTEAGADAGEAGQGGAIVSGSKRETVQVWQTFWGNEWGNKGEERGGGVWEEGKKVVVEVRPDWVKEYYQERQGFDPLSFLKNPMILMALASLGLIVGLPYLTENMDEETRKEFEEMQSKSPLTGGAASERAAAVTNFDMAGWLAGKK